MKRNIKPYFFFIVAAACVYEGVALLNGPTGDSISEIIWSLNDKGFTIPLVLIAGLVCGHLFWYRR